LDKVEDMMSQFSSAFTVTSVMTKLCDMQCAETADQAAALYQQYKYDVVPQISGVDVTRFYERGSELVAINRDHLISDGTRITDLFQLLSVREFYFVLASDRISGYIHFSDLNTPLVRVPIYMLLQATERHLLSIVMSRVNTDDLEEYLGVERIKQLGRFLNSGKRGNADTSIWDVLGIQDTLSIVFQLALAVELRENDINCLKALRNDIAHVGNQLIDRHSKANELARQLRLCDSLRRIPGEATNE